jgi:hypothetical protein
MYRVNGKPVEGIVIHRDSLPEDERQTIAGMCTTTAARTAFDLGRRGGRTLATVRVDALAHATGLTPASVHRMIARHPGARGLRQLRQVVELMDGGSESPQETRTRLVLVDSGLPRPRTQIVVDRWRIDMGYEDFGVGNEYDVEIIGDGSLWDVALWDSGLWNSPIIEGYQHMFSLGYGRSFSIEVIEDTSLSGYGPSVLDIGPSSERGGFTVAGYYVDIQPLGNS